MSQVTRGRVLLTSIFAFSGALHLVRPKVFESTVPKFLPYARELVYASGVAEIACAAGMLHPMTRRNAGLASAALLVAVLPANVQMAVDARRRGSTAYQIGTLVRLPLQWPLIRMALRVAER